MREGSLDLSDIERRVDGAVEGQCAPELCHGIPGVGPKARLEA